MHTLKHILISELESITFGLFDNFLLNILFTYSFFLICYYVAGFFGDSDYHINRFISVSEPNTKPVENITEKESQVNSQANDFNKKSLSTPLDDRISVHQELLSENSLLHMPNLRTAVDDLMLTSVDNGSALLDNSTSSDEVMNVDQFVNERFKKITEPELDISGSSLNLDLPPLDLFHFHTS